MKDYIAVVGILFTIAFGIPTIIALARRSRSKLVLIEEPLIDIRNRLLKGIEGLEIKYRGQDLDSNIYHYRSILINYGNKDIPEENVKAFPALELPENTIWLDSKIRNTSKGLKSELITDIRSLEIHFDMLKPSEFISFEGYIKSQKDIKIGSIEVNQRIRDIKKIERNKDSELEETRSNIPSILLTSIVIIVSLITIISTYSIYAFRNLYDKSASNYFYKLSSTENSDWKDLDEFTIQLSRKLDLMHSLSHYQNREELPISKYTLRDGSITSYINTAELQRRNIEFVSKELHNYIDDYQKNSDYLRLAFFKSKSIEFEPTGDNFYIKPKRTEIYGSILFSFLILITLFAVYFNTRLILKYFKKRKLLKLVKNIYSTSNNSF